MRQLMGHSVLVSHMERRERIKQYKENYRRYPELMGEIEALEQLFADAFSEEAWT